MAEKNDSGVGAETTLSHRVAAKADKIKYAVLAVVAVVVIGGVVLYQQRSSAAKREAEAENRVFQTLIDIQSTPESDALPVLAKAAEDLKGLPAGSRALMMQFSYAFNTKEYAAAEAAARSFISTYPKSTMLGRANLALGQSLVMQGKVSDAILVFDNLVKTESPEIFAEAKLALAQSYELEAERLKDSDPAAAHRNLQSAEREYNDIIVRSRTTVGQRGFWPQAITLPADFSLILIKDKLAGYQHEAPRGPESAALNTVEREAAVMATPPPSDEREASEEPAATDGEQSGPEAGEEEAPAAEEKIPESEPAGETEAATESGEEGEKAE